MPRGIYGIVTTHIAPARGYGGVAISSAELLRALGRAGYCIMLCASDASQGGRLAVTDLTLEKGTAVRLYSAYWARRWGFGIGAIGCVLEVCRHSKAVYVNGIATWPTTLAALSCILFKRKCVIAVHGGLMPEHVAYIRQRKPWKWLFYRLLTIPTLRRATAVHCTSEEEAVGAKELLGPDCKCVIIGNGVDLHHAPVLTAPLESSLTFCYVGRISPEKGVNEFIRAWLSCRKPQERLIVVGGGEGKYFSDFLALAQDARSGIDYRGYVGREGVFSALEESHFLILPSGLGKVGVRENFGIAVAEALGAGRPVMVTRGLSWDHLEQDGAGMVFDRTEEAVRLAIERARAVTTTEWARMATAARAYAERELDIKVLAERLMSVLRG